MNRLRGPIVVLVGTLLIGGVIAGSAVLLTNGDQPEPDTPGILQELWVSNTTRDIQANHHSPVAAQINGTAMVYAPISGVAHEHTGEPTDPHTHAPSGCALVALYGSNGSVRWANQVPAANCTIHSVADPTLGDIDTDSVVEVLAATTEDAVKAFQPFTGRVTFRYALSGYGYTQPLVANVTGGTHKEIVIVDVKGSVFVLNANGSTVWVDRHRTYTWGQPRLADFDADGAEELFVALGNATMLLYNMENGSLRWQHQLRSGASLTWTAAGQADGDPAAELVVATDEGHVQLFDGRTGNREWSVDFGEYAAVNAMADGDGDGMSEIYAVARDGVVRSVAANTGRVEWQRNVTQSNVQMMPPPSIGDLDGDGRPELVVPTNNGRVLVLNPVTGDVLASYARDIPIWTTVDLADIDGDGAQEIIVMYGNGQVAALEYRPEKNIRDE